MKAYITILGRSVWALINTFYAVLREKRYFPDQIYVFAEENYIDNLGMVEKGIKILSKRFGFSPKIKSEEVEEANFLDAGLKISKLINELKADGVEVAVDITPGRKALVVGTLVPGPQIPVDHIFYLALKTLEDVSKPYMMIPLHIQHLIDYIDVMKKQKVFK